MFSREVPALSRYGARTWEHNCLHDMGILQYAGSVHSRLMILIVIIC